MYSDEQVQAQRDLVDREREKLKQMVHQNEYEREVQRLQNEPMSDVTKAAMMQVLGVSSTSQTGTPQT